MSADIPERVRRFIADHVDSVSLLDVLLLVRATPDKAWTAEETGRALVSGEEMAAGHFARLARDRLVVEEERGHFRYSPGPKGEVVDELAEWHARRRHTVIGLIYGSDVRHATTISDAFRIRRRKP